MEPVVERCELTIKEGQEAAFIDGFRKVKHIAVDAAGATSVRLGRGVEHPSKFLLLIEWESVDAHTAFTKTPPFKEFSGVIRAHIAEPPVMSHYKDEA